MTTDATIGRVSRPRGVLSDEQMDCLNYLRQMADAAEDEYRDTVLDYLKHKGVSFSEMSKFTGLSTNTLQRWKREAGK